MFAKIYDPMFAKSDKGAKAEPFYKWDAKSTYIQKPPYWEDAFMSMPALKKLKTTWSIPK